MSPKRVSAGFRGRPMQGGGKRRQIQIRLSRGTRARAPTGNPGAGFFLERGAKPPRRIHDAGEARARTRDAGRATMDLRDKLIWIAVAALGAVAFGIVALTRGEPVNAAWLVTAAVCIYFIAYRFYALFIVRTALGVDPRRVDARPIATTTASITSRPTATSCSAIISRRSPARDRWSGRCSRRRWATCPAPCGFWRASCSPAPCRTWSCCSSRPGATPSRSAR